MLWVSILLVLVLNIVAVALLFKDVKKNAELYPDWKEAKPPKSVWIYVAIVASLSVAMTVFVSLFYEDNTWTFTLKRMLLLALLGLIGYIDFKTYRIPNIYILAGLVTRVVFLVIELICREPAVWYDMLMDVIVAVIILVIALVCTIFVKNGIGFGDMKLMCIMALFLGRQGIWGAMFLSLLVSFVISIYLLLSKKKNRKDAIPFGPAIVAGTYLSVFLTGM